MPASEILDQGRNSAPLLGSFAQNSFESGVEISPHLCHPLIAILAKERAERLIGSIRCECLDHMIVLGEAHLRRILKSYACYYNETRTHLALEKDAPLLRPVKRAGRILCRPVIGGLHHEYVRI